MIMMKNNLNPIIYTKTMFLGLPLLEYVKSKIICLFIGHAWRGGQLYFIEKRNLRYCGRCCDSRSECF